MIGASTLFLDADVGSKGTKIRLTSDYPSQELRLLPLDLVRQRQVKGESKCAMHNGMSYSHSITVLYLLLLPASRILT